jgi:hypothetical protein
MVTNRVETLAGRRQTAQLIKDDPTTIVLRRRVKLEVPGGGWRWETQGGTPLQPQVVKLIPFKRRMTQFLISTELGPVADLPYVLLGFHDMDIARGDLFSLEGGEFEVKTLDLSEPEIKVSAAIDYYGGGVNG